MAGRLNLWRSAAGAARPGRRAVAVGLALAVVIIHGCVTSELAQRMDQWKQRAAMPPRMQVAYVREMDVVAPPVPAPAPAPPVPAPAPAAPRPAAPVKKRAAARAAAPSSSAVVAQAAPAPETAAPPVGEPGPPVEEQDRDDGSMAAMSSVFEPGTGRSAESAPPFVWPVSTRLSYVLSGNYRGEIHGTAQVEWVRIGMRYQVHLDVTVGLKIAPLLTRRMSSEGLLTPDGLVPERYDEDSKLAFHTPSRNTIRFKPGAVVLSDGRLRERWPGVQDAASQFVQLTYLFTTQPGLLHTGAVVEVPLALPRSVSYWAYDVRAKDTVHTRFGAVEAFHLQPRRVARAGGDLTAEIWFAPGLAYLPARILIHQDADTFIDLVLARKPELAAQ